MTAMNFLPINDKKVDETCNHIYRPLLGLSRSDLISEVVLIMDIEIHEKFNLGLTNGVLSSRVVLVLGGLKSGILLYFIAAEFWFIVSWFVTLKIIIFKGWLFFYTLQNLNLSYEYYFNNNMLKKKIQSNLFIPTFDIWNSL